MSTRGDILRRAAQVEPDAVPEPWRASDDEDALATVSDREHYRKNLVTLPDGAGEVPAYVWDFPRTPTIPDEVREEWTRGSAGRVLNAQGQYVSRGSDVPRKSFDGEEPGLLVEAASRTNNVQYSSSITSSDWDSTGGIASESSSTSVIDGEDANKVTGDGNDICFLIKNCATFSGNTEVAHCIVERGTADSFYIEIKNSTSGNKVFQISYDWVNDTSNIIQGSAQEVNARTLQANGPNNKKIIQLIARYSGGNSANVNGENRQISLIPDFNKNSVSNILHHAQLEEAPNASSPIVTGSSPTTRAGDGYVIPKGDWWNTKEGTFIFEFVPQLFYQPFDSKQFGFTDSNGEPTSYFNIYWADNPAPFEIQVQHNLAGPNRTVAPGTAAAFQKSTFACSFSNSGKLIVSLNGQSNTRQNTKATAPLLEEKDIQTGDASFVRYADISYLPRALPESTLNRITAQ